MTYTRLRIRRTDGSPGWAAGLLVAAALLANLAFAMLGSVFGYPDVLRRPAPEILEAYREHQAAVSLWFGVLTFSAGLMAPAALAVGRLVRHPAMRIAVPVGVAAAVVQVVGLSRWLLLVPGYAAEAAAGGAKGEQALASFRTAHQVLGVAIGETAGYLLTAAWTILVVVALHGRLAGAWFSALGGASAVAILAGALSPLDVPAVDQINFGGYVAWSVWLLAFAGALQRDRARVVTSFFAKKLGQAVSRR